MENLDIIDTMTIMTKYNFNKPINISIIYENQEEEPIYSHAHRDETVLMNRVAEILVSMKEALVHYCNVIPKCRDEKRKDRLKAHWLRVKHKMFNECLALSKEFLSQHGVTDRFIKDILCSIEQIAKVPITYNILSNIHHTLLKWIELKQFQMANNFSEQSKNDPIIAQKLHQHFSSRNVFNNMPASSVYTSGQPGNQLTLGPDPTKLVQWRNDRHTVNCTIPASSYIQEDNTGTHRIPQLSYSVHGVNDQRTTVPNAPMCSSTNSYTEPQLNNSERLCYNDTQINNINTMLPISNQKDFDDITRNSISRDSGFMSPMTTVSSENNYDIIQYPFMRYEKSTSNFQLTYNWIDDVRPV